MAISVASGVKKAISGISGSGAVISKMKRKCLNENERK